MHSVPPWGWGNAVFTECLILRPLHCALHRKAVDSSILSSGIHFELPSLNPTISLKPRALRVTLSAPWASGLPLT